METSEPQSDCPLRGRRVVFAIGLSDLALDIVKRWSDERDLTLVMPTAAADIAIDPVLVLVGSAGGMHALETLSQVRSENAGTQLFFIDDGPEPVGTSAALLAGADDAARPQDDPVGLLARLDARLRRASGVLGRVIQLGALFVDVSSRRMVLGGAALDLRNAEFKLLLYLAAHAARPVSASELRDSALHTCADDHTVRNHVYELRQKLRRFGFPDLIHTLPGIGYQLRVATRSDPQP